ncbi:MAG: ABC transporter permease [Candidatus Acidiferrales bacterium]
MLTLLRMLVARMRGMFARRREDEEFSDEIREHLDMLTEENVRRGMPLAEAQREARIRLGGATQLRETHRELTGLPFLETLFQDVRYALRMLRKSPGFTAVAVLTLALGIGASTIGFSIFYNLMFNAFAARDASRLVVPTIHDEDAGRGEPLGLSLADFEEIRKQNNVFESVVGYITWGGLVLASEGPHMYQFFVSRVTSDAFDFYGVPALLGRGIEDADGSPAAPGVFVISYDTWKQDFNGDPEVLGKNFVVDGEPRTLIGVMPPRFHAFGPNEEIWIPLDLSQAAPKGPFGHFPVFLLARLKRGVTLQTASTNLDVIEKRLAAAHAEDFPKHFRVGVKTAEDDLIGPQGPDAGPGFHSDVKHLLYDLLAAVMMLLLIACSNVANLLLARASTRERELAVRSALGASRGRIIRQLLVESSILAIAACLVGCAFAWCGLKIIVAFLPHVLASGSALGGGIGAEALLSLGLNVPVLLFAVVISLLTVLICGLVPAVHVVLADLQPQLTGAAKTGGSAHGRLRSALVVSEVALSIVLLVGAGLLMRTLFLLTHVNLGFNPKNVMMVVFLPPPGHAQLPPAQEFASPLGLAILRGILDRMKGLPGVTDVSIEDTIPGYGPGAGPQVTVPSGAHTEEAGVISCDESFLDTLQLRLLQGRWLSSEEVQRAAHDVVVNQELARDLFGSKSPLGQQIQVKSFQPPIGARQDTDFQVVGVVADIRNAGPQKPSMPLIFLPYTVGGGRFFLLKTTVNPLSLVRAVRDAVWSVDRDEVIGFSIPLEEFLQRNTYSNPEFGLTISGPLAGIALLLVIAGIFSVMAYNVSLRTHEIGIRMALGAQQDSILRMILLRGIQLVLVGIVVGVAASLALTRFIASQIWGISATDPLTFAGVALLLTFVALAACWIPARRAMKVDPMVALRYE